MATKHKLRATIPYGDSDIGAEIECEIAFTFLKGAPEQGPSYASGGQPADPDEIEFVGASMMLNGKLHRYDGPFPIAHQQTLDALAEDWLYSDDGQAEAYATVRDDDDAAREYRDEQRAARTDIDDILENRERAP